MSVVTALVRAAFLVDAVYAESARDHNLTSQQGQLLCVLMGQPEGIGMSELGGMLNLAKSSLTGMIDRSLKRGLVRREAASHDGRAVRVVLTEEGARVAEGFFDDSVRRLGALPDVLGEDDKTRLGELLGRVVTDNKVPAVFQDFVDAQERGDA